MALMKLGSIIQVTAEFGPIVAFFVAGQLLTFTQAVWVLVLTTTASLLVSWYYHRQWPLVPVASALLVIVAGSLTIYFDMPNAIIFSDTIYFWGLAAAIGIGLLRGRYVLERVFNQTFAISPAGWRLVSYQWITLLFIAGAGNEYVRIAMTPEFWIDYKFVKVILMVTFFFLQVAYARKYRIVSETNQWGLRI